MSAVVAKYNTVNCETKWCIVISSIADTTVSVSTIDKKWNVSLMIDTGLPNNLIQTYYGAELNVPKHLKYLNSKMTFWRINRNDEN